MKPRKPGEFFIDIIHTPQISRPTPPIVTERSIHSLKRKALRRIKTRTLAHDPETGQAIRPGRISVFFSKFKNPFTRTFWEDAFEQTDNESLVDGKLLSYAYLEVGMIEAIGW
jgi:sodium/potassium-transporting ATPase subunit alpha